MTIPMKVNSGVLPGCASAPVVFDGGGKGVWRPKRQHVLRFLFMGIFGMFGNQFCYILGLVYIDAGLASVVNLMTPICAW